MESNPGLDPNKRIRVLSIDGGGIKGLIPLYFLDLLEKSTGKPVYELFDFFAGTSIGGILSLVFSQKIFTAGEFLVKMLGQLKNKIFPSKRYFSYVLFKKSLYDPNIIEEVLQEILGQISFKNSKGNFMITGSELKDNKCEPFVFVKSLDKSDYYSVSFDPKAQDFFKFVKTEIDHDVKLWQIGRVTSAALPFFASYKDIPGRDFLDGGFTYNNPSFLCIKYLEEVQKIDLSNVFMLSLGCNMDVDSQSLAVDFLKKSVLSFNSELVSNIKGLNDNMNNVSYHALLLADSYLRSRHVRIAPTQMRDISLDNVDNQSICEIQMTARNMIKDLRNLHPVICREMGLNENELLIINKKSKFYVVPRFFKFREFYKKLDEMIINEVDQNDIYEALESFTFPEDVAQSQQIILLPENTGGIFCCGNRNSKFSLAALALSIGHLDILRKFISDFKDPFAYLEFNRWSPFQIAAANGELCGILLLIENEFLVPNTLNYYSTCFNVEFKSDLGCDQYDRLRAEFETDMGKRYDEKTAKEVDTPLGLATRYGNQEILNFYNYLKKMSMKRTFTLTFEKMIK